MRAFAAVFAAVALLSAPSLAAEAAKDDWDGGFGGKPNKYRGDVTLGLSYGLGLGHAVGYPNDVGRIGDTDYQANTRVAAGPTTYVWLGGALTDWLNFNLGLAFAGLNGNELKTRGTAFVFRTEAFPLLSLADRGRAFTDFGAYTAFGIGVQTLKHGDEVKADGGAISYIGFGVFHETGHFGHVRLGPVLDGTYVFSQSLELWSVTAGARLAFYAGP